LRRNLRPADLDHGLARRRRRLVRDQDRRRDRTGQSDRDRHQDGGLEAVEEGIRGGIVEPPREARLAGGAELRRGPEGGPNGALSGLLH
jgi:hypothetical protein